MEINPNDLWTESPRKKNQCNLNRETFNKRDRSASETIIKNKDMNLGQTFKSKGSTGNTKWKGEVLQTLKVTELFPAVKTPSAPSRSF